MSTATKSRLLPWVLLLSAGIPWGATFVMTIIAVERGDHPLGIAFWQTLIGTVMLVTYNAVRGKGLFPVSRFYLKFYAVCGFLGTGFPATLFLYAAEHVQAGILSLSTATVPMMTFAVAVLCRLEGFSTLKASGLALGCAAIAMVTVPETSLPDPSAWPWVLVSVLAASSYAVENVIIDKYLPSEDDPFVVLAGMLVAGTLMLSPVMLAVDAYMMPAWPLEAVEWSIIGMAVINVFAYGLFIHLVTTSGAVFASQMGYVVTLSGIAWGMIIFGEAHSAWFWSALVLMMVGMTLVRPREDSVPVPSRAEP